MTTLLQLIDQVANATTITANGATGTLPPALLAGLVQQESGGNPTATSPVQSNGTISYGLTQLSVPGVGSGLYTAGTITDPLQNLTAGAHYLAQLITQFNSIPWGVAAYNAGPGAAQAALNAGQTPDSITTHGNYVSSVLTNAQLAAQGAFSWLGGSASTSGTSQGSTNLQNVQNQSTSTGLTGLSPSQQTTLFSNLPFGLGSVFTAVAGMLGGFGQSIGKWLILALLGIGIFILTLHLVTGGQSTEILQTATKAAAT